MENQQGSLDQLLGDWVIDVEYEMTDDTVLDGTGTAHGEADGFGRGVRLDIQAAVEGLEEINESYLIVFDDLDQKVHLFNLAASGPDHDHVGKWIEDYSVEFEWSGTVEGQAVTEHVDLNMVGPDEIQIRERDIVDGKRGPRATYVLTRQ
jgi:hypothetical protein